MKTYRKELWIQTPTRRAFVNLTPQVEACLAESGIREGLALVRKTTLWLHPGSQPLRNSDLRSGLPGVEPWLRLFIKLSVEEAMMPSGQHRNKPVFAANSLCGLTR